MYGDYDRLTTWFTQPAQSNDDTLTTPIAKEDSAEGDEDKLDRAIEAALAATTVVSGTSSLSPPTSLFCPLYDRSPLQLLIE